MQLNTAGAALALLSQGYIVDDNGTPDLVENKVLPPIPDDPQMEYLSAAAEIVPALGESEIRSALYGPDFHSVDERPLIGKW